MVRHSALLRGLRVDKGIFFPAMRFDSNYVWQQSVGPRDSRLTSRTVTSELEGYQSWPWHAQNSRQKAQDVKRFKKWRLFSSSCCCCCSCSSALHIYTCARTTIRAETPIIRWGWNHWIKYRIYSQIPTPLFVKAVQYSSWGLVGSSGTLRYHKL